MKRRPIPGNGTIGAQCNDKAPRDLFDGGDGIFHIITLPPLQRLCLITENHFHAALDQRSHVLAEELHHPGIRKTDCRQHAMLFCQRLGLKRRGVPRWRCHEIALQIHPI